MQEELNRARSLLRCSESVETVIQLLDQTFQRLQSDVATADLTDATLTVGPSSSRHNVTSSESQAGLMSIHFTQEQVNLFLFIDTPLELLFFDHVRSVFLSMFHYKHFI